MNVYHIAYTFPLPNSLGDYSRIRKAMLNLGEIVHADSGEWYLASEYTQDYIANHLINFVRVGDRLRIMKVQSPVHVVNLPKKAIEFLLGHGINVFHAEKTLISRLPLARNI